MSRYLKALAIGTCIGVAACAGAASAYAVPAEFSWASGSKTKISAEGEQIKTTTAGETKCNVANGEASKSGTGGTSITTSSLTFTDEGKEDKCRGPFGTSPTVKMNGCQYDLTAGTTKGDKAAGESEGTLDIVNCGVPNSITTESVGCTIHVPEQLNLGPVMYRTIAGPPEHVTMEAKITNLVYIHTGALCGNGEGKNGTLTFNWTLKDYDSGGTQTNFTVT